MAYRRRICLTVQAWAARSVQFTSATDNIAHMIRACLAAKATMATAAPLASARRKTHAALGSRLLLALE